MNDLIVIKVKINHNNNKYEGRVNTHKKKIKFHLI